MSDSIVSLKPIVHYPRKAEVGRTYLMTIDLQPEDGYDWQSDWHFEEEEYPIYCAVESDLFSSKSIGSPVIVIHRFGGSYGSAKFLLKAAKEAKWGELKIALINTWGVTVKILPLEKVELTIAQNKKHIKTSKYLTKVRSEVHHDFAEVFISYSHDSQSHIDRVLELSNRLRSEGIDCNIDQYEETYKDNDGWQRWMLKQVESARFILVICTEKYNRYPQENRSDRSDKNTTWEGCILVQELRKIQGINAKFIPVVFAAEDVKFIPMPLRSVTNYNLNDRNGYELLYRRLTHQWKTIKPTLGKQITLAARERKQSFRRPIFCNIPNPSYNQFIGRKAEVASLLERISHNYSQFIHVVVGIGGIGKTALVIEVAYRCLEAQASEANDQSIPIFEAIIFTSLKRTDLINQQVLYRPVMEESLLNIFRVIAETLKEPTIIQLNTEQQQIQQVYKILGNQSTLLIVDSMETLTSEEHDKIMLFLHNVPRSTQVVITSREHLGLPSIRLGALIQQESHQLIEERAKSFFLKITTQQKNQIHKRFGGIPIAMIYAIAQRAYRYRWSDILKPTAQLPHDLGKFCFEGSVSPLRGTIPHQLLIAMTFFRDPPCQDALIEVAGVAKENQHTKDGLAKLQQLSLIAEQDGRYTILSITRDYAQNELIQNIYPDVQESMIKRRFNWYLKFTKKYGGDDWENWRDRYDQIEAEWGNIESILYWHSSHKEWEKVLELWEQVDRYVDLNGYWQKRRHWWSKLEKETTVFSDKVQALSEKAWTTIMMGTNHDDYLTAVEWLNEAWLLRDHASQNVRADIASHLGILETGRGNYVQAEIWLDIESDVLRNCSLPEKQRVRLESQNLYYRAEINYFRKSYNVAKEQFEKVIELCREIGWERFRNYAHNYLANILIEAGELERAKNILISELDFAERMREKRRIALYYSSYAYFYHQLAQQSEFELEAIEYSITAQEYALKAAIIFDKEQMLVEKQRIEYILESIEDNLSKS